MARGLDRLASLCAMVVRSWALLGGLLLVAIVLLTGTSVVLDLLYAAPIPGDFELVEMGCAVAAFSFLPYCQLQRGHINVDLFTARAPHWFKRSMSALSSALLLLLALLLLWRMSLGAIDYYDPLFPETTAILGVPLWIAFIPTLASLFLWTLASLVCLIEDLAEVRSA